jgi:integrase
MAMTLSTVPFRVPSSTRRAVGDAHPTVLRRRQGTRENPNDAVFPTRNGTWQQVNNVERRWRQIRKDTGLDWVTPHTFRKTGATLISERVDTETAASCIHTAARAV